jgi:hypothetical protein
MSNRHPNPGSFAPPNIRGDERAWGGIRDGGRRGRRTHMYAFLCRHKDGRGLTPGQDNHRFYLQCLEYARSLSRTKGYQPKGSS